jgi:hypothetical protein
LYIAKAYQVFNYFSKHHTKILIEHFHEKLGREDIFKQAIGNDSLHQDSNNNGVAIVNFATSKTMFPYCNFHKYTCTPRERKTHNHVHHIFTDRQWHPIVLEA